jgi:hypothetical protein
LQAVLPISFPSESLRMAYPCVTTRTPSPSQILFFLLVILRQRTENLASAGSSDGLSGDSQTVSEEFPSCSGCCGDTFNRLAGRSEIGCWICCGVDPDGLVSNGDLNGLYMLHAVPRVELIDQELIEFATGGWLQTSRKMKLGGRRVVDARPLPDDIGLLLLPNSCYQTSTCSFLHERVTQSKFLGRSVQHIHSSATLTQCSDVGGEINEYIVQLTSCSRSLICLSLFSLIHTPLRVLRSCFLSTTAKQYRDRPVFTSSRKKCPVLMMPPKYE